MVNGERVRETYNNNHQYILAPNYKEGDVKSYYNFPINQIVQDHDIEEQMREIFRGQSESYKLNLSAGVILQEKNSNQTRYFKPAPNTVILTYPIHIWNNHSLERAIQKLLEKDINEMIRHYRPDSGYVVRFVTQLEYYVYSTDFPLGQEINLPPFVKNNRTIVTRQNLRNGLCLDGKLCFFNSLAQSQCQSSEERLLASIFYKVTALYIQWQQYCLKHLPRRKVPPIHLYGGFQMSDLPHAEECFGLNINVLEYMADKTAYSRYTSMKQYDTTVHMNIYQNHLSLIVDMELYAKRFICVNCERVFKRRSSLIRHATTCNSRVKHTFPGGYYKYHKNIFS
jgi:hypothetical protein